MHNPTRGVALCRGTAGSRREEGRWWGHVRIAKPGVMLEEVGVPRLGFFKVLRGRK